MAEKEDIPTIILDSNCYPSIVKMFNPFRLLTQIGFFIKAFANPDWRSANQQILNIKNLVKILKYNFQYLLNHSLGLRGWQGMTCKVQQWENYFCV